MKSNHILLLSVVMMASVNVFATSPKFFEEYYAPVPKAEKSDRIVKETEQKSSNTKTDKQDKTPCGG